MLYKHKKAHKSGAHPFTHPHAAVVVVLVENLCLRAQHLSSNGAPETFCTASIVGTANKYVSTLQHPVMPLDRTIKPRQSIKSWLLLAKALHLTRICHSSLELSSQGSFYCEYSISLCPTTPDSVIVQNVQLVKKKSLVTFTREIKPTRILLHHQVPTL